MSPNTPPVFEALPAEVLGHILQQLASPEDLGSTIRASPNAFGSFRCFREAIIIEVLQTHLPPEIFAEYLGLLHIPKYEDFNWVPNQSEFREWSRERSQNIFGRYWEHCRYLAWTRIVTPFFQTHFKHIRTAKLSGIQRYSIPRPTEKEHISYMISMYGTLKRFIQDYQSFVRCILGGNYPPLTNLEPPFRRENWLPYQKGMADLLCDRPVLPHNNWPPLNASETLRLQRGFLRYELCCRLNGLPAWDMRITQSFEVDFGKVFDSLSNCVQRWEEEEIRCIWTYVHRQYQVLVREIFAEYRSDIRRLHRKSRRASQDEVVHLPNISIGGEDEDEDQFGSWTYNMSCLGLSMLQQLLRSGFDNQRRFLKNTTFQWRTPFRGALFLKESNPLRNEWDPQAVFINRPTTRGATQIYRPIISSFKNFTMIGNPWRLDHERLDDAETRLKEVGWVFWEDTKRLESTGLRTPEGYTEGRLCLLLSDMSPLCFGSEQEFPESSMSVAVQDVERELSDKYAVDPTTQDDDGEYFFRDRLRNISNWSSKEISPHFQQICLGAPLSP